MNVQPTPRHTSRSAKLLGLAVILPLTLIAGLTAYSLQAKRTASDEVVLISRLLDETLERKGRDYRARLAIMPLKNSSGRDELDYLARGLSAEISARLKSTDGLLLIDEDSARNIDEVGLSLPDSARLLGADHMLTGELSLRDQRYEVAVEFVQLRDAGSERGTDSIWRQRWQADREQLPELSRIVAMAILDTLLPTAQANSLESEQDLLSPLALEAWLQARELVARDNSEDVLRGIAWLESVISDVPTFAPAYRDKISAHARMTWLLANQMDKHIALRRETVDRWLAQQIEHPLTYRLRAYRADAEYRKPEALAAFQLARQMAPNEYRFDAGYRDALCGAGYLDRCLEQATGLALKNPISATTQSGLANVYWVRGETDQMLTHARLAQRFGGDMGTYYQGIAALRRQQWDDALSLLEQAQSDLGMGNAWVADTLQALRYPTDANTAAALAALEASDEASQEWHDYFYVTLVYLGELDLAFAMADELVSDKNATWMLYTWEDEMRPFRDDPRFLGLMEAMQITDLWRIMGPPDACTNGRYEPFCDRLAQIEIADD